MKLSQLKKILPALENVVFRLENGNYVPDHFHITEVGIIQKNFIDCGGTIRTDKTVSFQLWNANDYDHRLQPLKLLKIIQLAEEKLGIGDWEIEVEYQSNTIGKYGLEFNGRNFALLNLKTDCLAREKCGNEQEKQSLALSSLASSKEDNCTPGSGCC